RIDSNVWQGKALGILAATPGPRAGAGVLQYASLATYFGGDVKGTLGIGRWSDAFDEENGVLRNADDITAFDSFLRALVT
ncbi:MAG: NADPH-dependent FMN reductase, partial [Pseudomonadota bacterium]